MNSVKLHMGLMGVIFFGSIHYGFNIFNMNPIESFSDYITQVSGKNLHLNKVIYLMIVASALLIMFKLTTWLPFLGESVLPGSLIPNKINLIRPRSGSESESGSSIETQVHVKPNTRVAYWASKQDPKSESESVPYVTDAYGDYSNSGVVLSDSEGVARLIVNKTTPYRVPNNKVIKSHVHYRELDQEYGMIGPVRTVYV